MPAIRIENKSEDDVIVTLDETNVFILTENESKLFEQQSKGEHTVLIHRRRIPRETLDPTADKPVGLEAFQAADEKPGSHIQLDTCVTFDVNASKTGITILQHPFAQETLHEDVIFVAYRTDISGAKTLQTKDTFANASIRRTYLFQQIKSAFLPIGIVGLIILFFGLFCMFLNVFGFTFHLGETSVNVRYAAVISGIGMLIFSYFLISLHKIRKRARSLWK